MPCRRCAGRDRQLGAGSGDLVGDVEVGVADERVAATGQDVPDVDVAAVAQVQHHVLGQRTDPVGLGDLLDEQADVGDVGVVEAAQHLPLHVGRAGVAHCPTLGGRVAGQRSGGRRQPTGAGEGSGTTRPRRCAAARGRSGSRRCARCR